MAGKRRPTGTAMPTRPKPRNALERAERIADELAGMREDHEWNSELLGRFHGADEAAVVAMWKAGTNEEGKPLTKFELKALTERWCQLFGFLPPMDGDAAASPRAPEPADTATINMKKVIELTGLSESTIERQYKIGKFPRPMQLSPRRIGWSAGEVKAWKAEREARRLGRTLNRR